MKQRPFSPARLGIVLTLLILSLGCRGDTLGPEPQGEGLQVLFIGNSLTYTNDLPAMVAALAEAGGEPIAYATVAYPDVALMDHWQGGAARGVLRDHGWDVVVMQQGPSSLPESQENLRAWTQVWAEAVRERGAVPALYMVWPSRSRPGDFPGVVASYTNAASASEAQLYPAGAAWLLAWERAPELSLYGPDGFHPSVMGSYLAALVIYGGLTDAPLIGLPSRLTLPGRTVTVAEDQAKLLQEVATEALAARTSALRDQKR